MEGNYQLGPSELFMIFFIMAGPIVNMMKFAQMTKGLGQAQINTLSWKTFVLVTPITVVMGLVGRELMFNWKIPVPILEFTAGLFFLIIAIRLLLSEKVESGAGAEVASGARVEVDPLTMALKVIINPYVCGTLIVVLALSQSFERTLLIFSVFILNLFLDCLALRFIRSLTGKVGTITLRILGSVLGILQAALAMTIIFASIKKLLGLL